MFLVDTDVLSALAKRRRHANLEAWIERQRAFDLFVSVISIGEIERGIALQQNKDRNFASLLAKWLDQVLNACRLCGRSGWRPMPPDGSPLR